MKVRKRLNRASAHDDVDTWPDVVSVHVFDGNTLINSGRRIGRITGRLTTILFDTIWLMSFAIILAMTQVPEVAGMLQTFTERSYLASVYVEGNTQAGQKQFKVLLDQFGFDTSKSKKQSDYIASIRYLPQAVSVCRNNSREIQVPVFVLIKDHQGRIVKDLTKRNARARIFSCSPSKSKEGIEQFVGEIVADNDLYYQSRLLENTY